MVDKSSERLGPISVSYLRASVSISIGVLLLVLFVSKVAEVAAGYPFSYSDLIYAKFLVQDFPSDRVLLVSQTLMQIDSFLAAGWVAGFALFWGFVTREVRGVDREIGETNDVIMTELRRDTMEAKATLSGLVSDGTKMIRDISMQLRYTFVSAVLPFSLLVASGVTVLVGLLSLHMIYVWIALYFLLSGSGTTLLSWYELHEFSIRLSSIRNQQIAWNHLVNTFPRERKAE